MEQINLSPNGAKTLHCGGRAEWGLQGKEFIIPGTSNKSRLLRHNPNYYSCLRLRPLDVTTDPFQSTGRFLWEQNKNHPNLDWNTTLYINIAHENLLAHFVKSAQHICHHVYERRASHTQKHFLALPTFHRGRDLGVEGKKLFGQWHHIKVSMERQGQHGAGACPGSRAGRPQVWEQRTSRSSPHLFLLKTIQIYLLSWGWEIDPMYYTF